MWHILKMILSKNGPPNVSSIGPKKTLIFILNIKQNPKILKTVKQKII